MKAKVTFVVGIAFAVSILAVAVFTRSEEVRGDCGPCQSSTPAELFEEFEYVFLGVVVDTVNEGLWYECRGPELLGGEVGSFHSVQFRVNTVWKGRVTETVFIRGGGECGYGFSVGEGYLIYANRYGGRLSPSFCGVVRANLADEHYEVLGPGWAPEPGSITGTQTQPVTVPTCPTATPMPTDTATTTPTPTITPVPTLTPTETSTPTHTPTRSPTPTPFPTLTATKTPSPTLSPTPLPSNTPVPTLAAVNTPSPTQSSIPTQPSPDGTCNVFAESEGGPIDGTSLILVAGIVWFGIRRRRR